MTNKFSTKALNKKDSKWTTPAYYSTGYKSTHKSYGNSSFWMNEDFLESDIRASVNSLDYVKLAGYKRAIGNFVRIVTGKDNIPVMYSSGNDSYTNGVQVVISSKLGENEFDSTVGLALHEGSHISLTDFNAIKKCLNHNSEFLQSIVEWHKNIFNEDVTNANEFAMARQVKELINIIEDRRIDRFVYDSAPGYQGYYQSLYEKYFNAKEIDQALLNGSKTELNWDNYLFHICNFSNPKRQLDALPGLRSIWNTISIPTINRLKSTLEVADIAVEVYKMIWSELGGLKTNAPQQAPEQEDQDGNGSPGEEGDNEIETSEEQNGEEGSGIDPNLDMQGDSSSSSEGNNSEQEGEGNGTGTPQTPKERKEKQALEKAIQKQKDFLNGNIKKKKVSKKDFEKINAAAEANMSYQSVGGDIPNDTNGAIIKRSKTQCMVVKGITDTLTDSRLLGGHASNAKEEKEYIIKYDRKDYIAEGIVLGTLLGKRLKTRDEDRSIKNTRMETGRIDRRMIAELGFGNDRVFSQTIHHTVTPSLIHISIDASGSMSGSKWEAAMKTAVAVAKAASMVASLDCIISIRGSYGGYNNQSPLMWVVYDSRKDKFNIIKDKMYAVQVSGSTPEGLCYQAVMKDIIDSANGKEAFFINICDGEPGYADSNISYGGEYAIQHTALQVKKMQHAGIKTLAYFVCDDTRSANIGGAKDNFRKMYGNNSEFIDANNLTQLSNSLNKLFVRK